MEEQILKSARAILLSITMMEAAALDMLDTVAIERQALRNYFPDEVEDTEPSSENPTTAVS